ncbi:MAG: methionyl-tRNA formyltransferase [Ignavibacterium sp.]|nr:methionyl-tRNA formyltransferase [Ignavibacterium sp.]MDW8374704.1 methionyl-tRNA formyltransferase [Ignavibacteriales bacterium]
MKIIFLGTPDFAIPSLQSIYHSNHDLIAVVTVPDKEQGRGRKLSASPVKKFAVEKNIPLYQPEKLKGNLDFSEQMKDLKPDLFVVVAFKILPKEIFEIPRYGSFNLHASLLPKYRGAAPIQWALINGETETGLTTFKLAEKVDTGNIYIQKRVQIYPDDNFGTLHNRLSELGAEVVMDTISLIESGKYELIPQDDSLATPAPKITKEICQINWNKSALEIHNLVRGLSPEPAAFFNFNGKIIKIFKTEVVRHLQLKPFEFFQTKKELFIGCREDSLKILEIQLEGKKRMGIEEFLRGFSFI